MTVRFIVYLGSTHEGTRTEPILEWAAHYQKGTFMRILIALGLVLSATAAHAQTWAELQAVPPNTEIHIEEQGGRGGHLSGILQSVEDVQLTIARGPNPVVIPKAHISRVRVHKPDPVWQGIVFGLLYATAMHVAYGDSSWTAKQTTLHYLGSAGFGAVIDWNIKSRRTLYQAP
jgi:hypothetical protein